MQSYQPTEDRAKLSSNLRIFFLLKFLQNFFSNTSGKFVSFLSHNSNFVPRIRGKEGPLCMQCVRTKYSVGRLIRTRIKRI